MDRVKVLIDDREQRLFSQIEYRRPDVVIEKIRLDVGDIHILVNDVMTLVIERKTRSDLEASLKDGRFHSQRARMVQFAGDNVCYIVEGGVDWSDPCSGAEIALIMRDRIPVMWSSGIDDTADLVDRLSRSNLKQRSCPPSNHLHVKTSRAQSHCPVKSLASMLRCVSGVSAKRATTLSAMFGSVCNMVKQVELDQTTVLNSISSTRDGTKKYGVALAKRILNAIGSSTDALL